MKDERACRRRESAAEDLPIAQITDPSPAAGAAGSRRKRQHKAEAAEMEQVLPAAEPDTWDYDPMLEIGENDEASI